MSNVIFKRFNSIHDFNAYLNSKKENSTFAGKRCDALVGDEYFCLTKDFQDANTRLLFGDRELAQKIDEAGLKKTRANIARYIKRRETFSSVVGFAANVPAYLAGAPNSMIAQRYVNTKQKVLTIAYNCAVSGGVDAEDIIRATSKLLSALVRIEASGVRVNLYACTVGSMNGGSIFAGRDQVVSFALKVKDSGQPLDLLKVAYPMAHPSFNRRHKFRFIEVNDEGVKSGWYGGYGCSETNDENTKKFLKERGLNVDAAFNYQSLSSLSVERIIERINKK